MSEFAGIQEREEFHFTREQLSDLLTNTSETHWQNRGTKAISSVVTDVLHTLDVDAEADQMGWRKSSKQLLSSPEQPDLEVRETLKTLLEHPFATATTNIEKNRVLEEEPILADWCNAVDAAKAALDNANGPAIEQAAQPIQDRQQQRGMELSR